MSSPLFENECQIKIKIKDVMYLKMWYWVIQGVLSKGNVRDAKFEGKILETKVHESW